MNRVKIIRQSPLTKEHSNNDVNIFGKGFDLSQIHQMFRIVLHEDFPMINGEDLRSFISYSIKQKKIVLSGCKAKIHPYRLMYISEEGYDVYLGDISNKIRGNRHWYPKTFQFVPALVSIPPNTPINFVNNPECIDMYIMPATKLLDNSLLLDRLFLLSIQKSSHRK